MSGLFETRRHFLSRCGLGLGALALAELSGRAVVQKDRVARVKNVIYLFMAGGPSQLELFDYKPKLNEWSGQSIPESYLAGKRFAFMDSSFKNRSTLLGSRAQFRRYGPSGAWVSHLMPYLAGVAGEVTFLKSCVTDQVNHAPAKLFMNTGSAQFGRPSLGSWVNYALGSESRDLPGFVVLQSGPRGPRGGSVNWGSGFLPSSYQGVPFRGAGAPILNLATPEGVSEAEQARVYSAIHDLNVRHGVETGDPELATRVGGYELAARMQMGGPELVDLGKESAATLALYGCDRDKPGFARNCLLARRLVERGVRFVQLYHTDWDSHGGQGQTIDHDLAKVAKEVDQGCAALILDLKSRGLLEDTLVVWGGEFGRTPMGEVREKTGRNHHIDAFTMWFAGGGVKAGAVVGETDELGFNAISERAHVHDIHATLLHLLGLDHEKLTVRFQGRDYRLTDVSGEVIPGLLG